MHHPRSRVCFSRRSIRTKASSVCSMASFHPRGRLRRAARRRSAAPELRGLRGSCAEPLGAWRGPDPAVPPNPHLAASRGQRPRTFSSSEPSKANAWEIPPTFRDFTLERSFGLESRPQSQHPRPQCEKAAVRAGGPGSAAQPPVAQIAATSRFKARPGAARTCLVQISVFSESEAFERVSFRSGTAGETSNRVRYVSTSGRPWK